MSDWDKAMQSLTSRFVDFNSQTDYGNPFVRKLLDSNMNYLVNEMDILWERVK